MGSQLEHLGQHGQGALVAAFSDHPRVLVLDLAATLPDLGEQHGDGVEDVERLEPRRDQRQAVFGGHEAVGALADDGRDVPGPEEAVEAQVRGLEDGAQRRDDRDVVGEDGEVRDLPRPASSSVSAVDGAVVSNPTAKKTTSRSGFSVATRRASRGE